MNTLINQRKKLEKLFIVNAMVLVIASCGGGGGGGGSSESSSAAPTPTPAVTPTPTPVVTPTPTPVVTPTPAVDYTPSSDKLTSAAQSSSELYVEPSFKFTNFQTVILDIFVTDATNQPRENLMLSVSVINSEIVDYDDPRLQEKSLLTKRKTGTNGRIYLNLELPNNVKKVLLELNALGVENDVIVSIDENGVIEHHFTQSQ